MKKLTQERVREVFDYQDGDLIWKISPNFNVDIGQIAGFSKNSSGYRTVKLDYRTYLLHRLVWLWHHSSLPNVLDHIDGNTLNNRIENLRVASVSQNAQNQSKQKRPTSSVFKGVSWKAPNKKWQASIKINQKRIYIGLYVTEQEAALAYNRKAIELFGSFANLNKIP